MRTITSAKASVLSATAMNSRATSSPCTPTEVETTGTFIANASISLPFMQLPDTGNLPTFAETLIAHAKLDEAVDEMQAIVDTGNREHLY